MNIKNFIELGEQKAGKQIELAKILDIRDTALRNAKSGKYGLPDAVCIELANYIGADPLEIIAASNLVTEKDERRRKVFENCLRKTNKAANFIVAALLLSLVSITSPNPANAGQATVPIAQQFVLC